MELGRERLGAQESVSKSLQDEISDPPVKGAWIPFYSPQKESVHWGVRDPDMSGSGAGHVRLTLLEPGLGAGLVRFRDLVS